MRKFILVVLALLIAPGYVHAKHAEKLHAKMSEHNHKKRMKKAAKECAPKHSLLHHHK